MVTYVSPFIGSGYLWVAPQAALLANFICASTGGVDGTRTRGERLGRTANSLLLVISFPLYWLRPVIGSLRSHFLLMGSSAALGGFRAYFVEVILRTYVFALITIFLWATLAFQPL